MKKQIKKWTLRIAATGVLLLLLLMGIVFNPSILYANHTTINNFTIYHHTKLDKNFAELLNHATAAIKTSELYNPEVKLNICLNDGSNYPKIMNMLRGPAFGWGFANKVVLMGNANCANNFVELHNYRWNFAQLIAHEATHCLQFYKFGFFKSNPVAGYPNWKWEGYPEYVARKTPDQLNLIKNIQRKLEQEKANENEWAIYFADSTIAPKEYYNAWLLVSYCLDVKKMTYEQLLNDTASEQALNREMMNWYEQAHE